jgi:AraC-like DNA-binding protein
MDLLTAYLTHLSLSARVFYSGRLCGISGDHASETAGHLHVLRTGALEVSRPDGAKLRIDEPTILFYPRPCRHYIHADEAGGADLVCASIEFGAGMLNPLVRSLPEVLMVPLRSLKALAPTVELIFSEAFEQNPGREPALDRLAEYFVILLLRTAITSRLIDHGVLSGLADSRLASAIAAMHARPAHAWRLEELAKNAGMSRARFAVNFREAVGMTPFEYLTDWRIGIAQAMLKAGKPLKIVAPSVGYASSAALSRAFLQRMGNTPAVWLARLHS